MAPQKKLEAPITLFAAIEAKQHEALRQLAFDERRSLADLVREAIDLYIDSRAVKPKRRQRTRTTALPKS